jgi:hypothetical protein
MITIGERSSRNRRTPLVQRLETELQIARSIYPSLLRSKLLLQAAQERGGIERSAGIERNAIFGLFYQARTVESRPRTQTDKGALHISLRSKTIERRIDPALDWHIRRRHLGGVALLCIVRIRGTGPEHRVRHEGHEKERGVE